MESIVSVLAVNAIVVVVGFMLMWLICQITRDCTPVDAYWGIGMGVLATSTFLQTPETQRSWVILVLCWAWALRLGGYMLWRWRDHGPDRRYKRMLEKAKDRRGWGFAMASMMLVVVPQAPLQFIISLPIQLAQVSTQAPVLGALAVVGVCFATMGLFFETVADLQLTAFRKNPENKGKVMRSGLWRYSRHPNYFGEACFWWGLFLIAAETTIGLFSIVSPIILTWILIKWSGVPTMEYRMRKEKAGYQDYLSSTSSFIPMPPSRKRAPAS